MTTTDVSADVQKLGGVVLHDSGISYCLEHSGCKNEDEAEAACCDWYDALEHGGTACRMVPLVFRDDAEAVVIATTTRAILMTERLADNDWIVEAHTHGSAFLVTPGGQRVALMTAARARGIAAALNTTEGRVAYLAAHSGPSPVGRPGQHQGTPTRRSTSPQVSAPTPCSTYSKTTSRSLMDGWKNSPWPRRKRRTDMADDGYVRVGALRAALDGLDDDVLVVMSKDGEGNGYSPLAEVDLLHRYVAETTWMGEIFNPEAEDDEDEMYEIEDGERCVVLWPTN